MSDESNKTPATYDSSLSPGIVVLNYKWKITFNDIAMVNLYIVYEINLWSHKTGTDFTLGTYLELLHSLKMLISISILIVDMVLDLMHKEVFHCEMVVGLIKM